MAVTDTFDLSNPDRPTIVKDPDAALDYAWDWSTWLTAYTDTISTFTITADSPLVVGTTSETSGVVTAFISGGTAESVVAAKCRIVTAGGRTDERSIYFYVRQR